MYWDYFVNERGQFRAKRLPIPTGATVKFKDITDLSDFREDLRASKSYENAVDTYRFFFDDPCAYEVEVETFEEVVGHNRNDFLGRQDYLKKEAPLLRQLSGEQAEGSEVQWLFLETRMGKRAVADGLFETKELTAELWLEFLHQKYRVVDLKELAGDQIRLKGNKAQQVKQVYEAIQQGLIKHPAPLPAMPTEAFFQILKDLQKKYVTELEQALTSWSYPEVFAEAIWEMVSEDVGDWPVIAELVSEKLPNSSDFTSRYSIADQTNTTSLEPNLMGSTKRNVGGIVVALAGIAICVILILVAC